MIFLESSVTEPGWNLALEEYLTEKIPKGKNCLFLWQNDKTVVIGKNQDTLGEINADYVREHHIRVRRRLSGGGAVYHDLGNLNYTMIGDAPENGGISFEKFCAPVVAAIRSFGVEASLSGRNDILVNGTKISGNAQYYRNGRVIHHGTILFDSDLDVLSMALNVDRSKFRGKGIASVKSRVTNLRNHLPENVRLTDLRQRLLDCIMEQETLERMELTPEDRQAVHLLQQRYDSWDWNYGYSPSFQRSEKSWFPNCGTVQVDYEMERGILTRIRIQGDFFGERDAAELERLLTGCKGCRAEILHRLREIQPDKYIHGVDAEKLAQMLAPEEVI